MLLQIFVADHSVIVFIDQTKVVLQINYIFAVLESGLDSLDQLRKSHNVIKICSIFDFTPNGVAHKMISFMIREYFDCFGQLPIL